MAWSAPHTWTTGEMLASADMNILERDVDYVRGDTSWTVVSAFSNSWANYGSGYDPAAYRKEGDWVKLRGLIAGGTNAQIAFTLPTGYRPPYQQIYPSLQNSVFGRVDVQTTGAVLINPNGTGSTAYVPLDDITFSVN